MASVSNQGLRNDLALNIKSILSHLEEDKVQCLVDFLISKGVKKESDLRRMTVKVLEEHLGDFIDASDLHDEWQKCYGSSNVSESQSKPANIEDKSSSSTPVKTPVKTPMQTNHSSNSNARSGNAGSSQHQPSTSRGSSIGGILAPILQQSKMPKFDKNSPYMPSAVRQAIEQKKRPTAFARVQLVERIVDHCRDTIPNLERADFNEVALDLVSNYPDTFKDTILLSEHGSDSLAKQMQTKYDNDKRPDVPTPKEREAPACKQAYGCIRWNPSLSEESSEESEENSREILKSMHTLSRKEWEWKLIKKHMDGSFYLQRKEINGPLATPAKSSKNKKRKRQAVDEDDNLEQVQNVSISDIKDRWPFLFTCRGMNYHFMNLTGIDFRSNMFEFVQEDSVILIEFLASKNENLAAMKLEMVRAERNGCTSAKLPALLKMLVNALKDDFSYLVRFVESTTLFEEVQTSVALPGTPVIIAAGSSLYDSKKFFLCIDGHPVTTEVTVLESFSMLFSSYFVLNIEYPPELCGLLNFCQRIIAKIAPQKGTRSKNAAVDKLAKDRVVKLNNKYVEYKQRVDKEN